MGAVTLELGPLLVGRVIKGNISTRTGERIYHVPRQKYYFVTRISWFRGERWFCSNQRPVKPDGASHAFRAAGLINVRHCGLMHRSK